MFSVSVCTMQGFLWCSSIPFSCCSLFIHQTGIILLGLGIADRYKRNIVLRCVRNFLSILFHRSAFSCISILSFFSTFYFDPVQFFLSHLVDTQFIHIIIIFFSLFAFVGRFYVNSFLLIVFRFASVILCKYIPIWNTLPSELHFVIAIFRCSVFCYPFF